MLKSQSEIDATMVDSSFDLIKVFIWAIPIPGFIGTVLGISDAVSMAVRKEEECRTWMR